MTLTGRALSRFEKAGELAHPEVMDWIHDAIARGEYVVGAEVSRRVLAAAARRVGEPFRRLRCRAFGALSWAYRQQGRYAAAERVAWRWLRFAEHIFGKKDPAVGEAHLLLGTLCKYRGRFSEATHHYRAALRICPPGHPDISAVHHNLGGINYAIGRLAQAEVFARRAVRERQALWGRNHPNVAQSIASLATILHARGRHTDAEALYREAIRSFADAYGRAHHEVAFHSTNLARLLQDRGDLVAADRLYVQALRVEEKVLGPKHPELAVALNNLGVLRIQRGRLTAARPLLVRARQILARKLGNNHQDTIACRANLAKLDVQLHTRASTMAIRARRHKMKQRRPVDGSLSHSFAASSTRQSGRNAGPR